jgi:hypothetical protein
VSYRARKNALFGSSTPARRWFFAAAVALSSAGCRCQRERPPDPDPDVASCDSACASLVAAGCVFEGSPGDERGRCVFACSQRSGELAPARCENERRSYLECVGRAEFDCRPLSCSASVCLEQGVAVPACGESYERLKTCIAPCLHAGTAHVGHQSLEEKGQRREVQTELVRAGCQKCPDVKAGAGAGAPCQAHSVCAQSCCRCPDGKAWFLARTCADGQCTDGALACDLGRRAAPVDPCAAPDHSR